MNAKTDERVKAAITRFNEYRSPEAIATLLASDDNMITVKFDGRFCTTCGHYDYFEDLVVELRDQGIDSEMHAVNEAPSGSIVEFKLVG